MASNEYDFENDYEDHNREKEKLLPKHDRTNSFPNLTLKINYST